MDGDDAAGVVLPLDVGPAARAHEIGEAVLICARTRPRFIGGERARYQEELK